MNLIKNTVDNNIANNRFYLFYFIKFHSFRYHIAAKKLRSYNPELFRD